MANEHLHHHHRGKDDTQPNTARDPVCGMTVKADASGRPFEFEGVTYYFCCPGCRRAFERDPHAYLSAQKA